MNNLKVGLELNDNGFKEQLAKDKAAISEIGEAGKGASVSMNSLVNDFLKISGASRQEFSRLLKQYTALTVAYRQLSEEEQNSAKGQALSQKLDEIREKAAFLKDAIGDAAAEISQLSSDTVYWDGLSEAMNVTKNSLQAFVSLTGLADTESEEFKETIAKLAQIETTFNAVISVTNALLKQSKIMTALSTAQTAAHTVAVKLNTKAKQGNVITTKAATIAQAAFNAVANANPYVLLASALIAVGSALYAFTKYTNAAAQAEKDAAKAAEELKKKLEELKKKQDEISSAVGKAKVSFFQLQTQWKALKTEADKKKWLEDNKTAFNQLGLEINNVKTAEDIFVNNTDAVVNALIAREMAAIKAKQAAEDLIELEKKRGDNSKATYVKANQSNVTSDEKDRLGINTLEKQWDAFAGAFVYKHRQLTKAELDAVNKLRNDDAIKRQKELKKQYDDEEAIIKNGLAEQVRAELEANKILTGLSDPKKSGGNSSPKAKPNANSRDAIKKQIADVDEVLSTKVTVDDVEAIQKLKAEKKRLQKLLDDLEIELGYKESPEAKQGLDKLKYELSELLKQLSSIPVGADASELVRLVEAKKREIEQQEIVLHIKADPKDALGKEFENVISGNKETSFSKAVGKEELNPSDYEGQLSAVETLMNANDALISQLDSIIEKYRELGLEGSEGFEAVSQKIKEVNENQDELAEKAKNIENARKTTQKFKTQMAAAAEVTGGLSSALTSLGNATQDEGLQIAGIIAEAIANVVAGYAAASAQSAEMGPWAWAAFSLAGIALVASVIAQIHSLSGYANGGIIQGSSTIGDQMIARVNAGEMILNNRQQSHLFDMINSGTQTDSPNNEIKNVRFVIEGRELVGVIDNYMTSKNKLR